MEKTAENYARQAKVLAITSQCMELLAPLAPDERKSVAMQLMVSTLDKNDAHGLMREFSRAHFGKTPI